LLSRKASVRATYWGVPIARLPQAIGTLGTRAIGSQKSMVTSETADETVAERLGR